MGGGDTLGVKNEKPSQNSLTWCPDAHVLLAVHYEASHWLPVGVIRCSLTYYKRAEHSFLITAPTRERHSQKERDNIPRKYNFITFIVKFRLFTPL